MAQTFDIRFARSAGLAAMFEAPSNSFRWIGSGSLSVDAQGISVAVKCGLFSLLARHRSRRISASNLKEVFREGEALRLEFATDGAARASLLVFARDRETAARIVNLLPTTRSVEIEESASAMRFRINWRPVILLAALLTLLIAGILVLSADREPRLANVSETVARTAPVSTDAQRTAGESSLASPAENGARPVNLPASDARLPSRPREIVIPVYPGRPAATSAQAPLDGTGAGNATDANATTAEGDAAAFAALRNNGEPPPLVFTVRVSADGIVPIVPGMASYDAARRELLIFVDAAEKGMWWELTVHVSTHIAFDDPALWPLRDAELAASRAWRNYSSAPDPAAEYRFAQELTKRVYQYVGPPAN